MKAVILAGGLGTRLHPVTRGEIPKPMAPLAGRPVLEHLVRRLAASGVRDICCTLQCLPGQIENYFGDGRAFGVHMEYRTEERPLGTAGAVKNCRDFYGDQCFLVLSGDGVFDFDLRPLMEAHHRHGSLVTMALCPSAEPLSYGLALTDRRGFIRGFLEKPEWPRVVTDLVNTGIYALSPAALDPVPENVPFDFARDLFPLLLKRGGKLFGLPLEGYWRDIGDPASYYRANLDALEGRLRLPETPDAPTPAAPPRSVPPRRTYACAAAVETPRRARLMRALAVELMEAGADFSDGLALPGERGGLHIAPDPDRSALRVESDDPDTLRRYAELVRRLDQNG